MFCQCIQIWSVNFIYLFWILSSLWITSILKSFSTRKVEHYVNFCIYYASRVETYLSLIVDVFFCCRISLFYKDCIPEKCNYIIVVTQVISIRLEVEHITCWSATFFHCFLKMWWLQVIKVWRRVLLECEKRLGRF